MENIKTNLVFENMLEGMITRFIQHFDFETPLQVTAYDFKESDVERVNELASKILTWVYSSEEEIKSHVARELIKAFKKMRAQGEKYVPSESYEIILAKLTHARQITIDKSGAFEVLFLAMLNDQEYEVYISVGKKFSLAKATVDILVTGGFKPSQQELEASNLEQGAVLYAFHLENENVPNLYKHYIALSAKEILAYIDAFLAYDLEDEEDIDKRIDCLLYLALFSYECGEKLPDHLYHFLIENGVFYYGELYLRADEKFAEYLIAIIGTVDDEEEYLFEVNYLIEALVAIPCRRTNDFLLESSKEPLPIWARKLYILPKDYSHIGGWETSDDGVLRILFDEEITVFERCAKKEASTLAPVADLPAVCGFCGQPLTLVFNGERKIATCLYCSCYQTIYTKTSGGEVQWHEKNAPSDFFLKNPKYMENDESIVAGFEYALRPTLEKRRATYTAHEYVEISRTQIGGMPTAINDIKYPKCPDCGQTMKFVAQFDTADIEDYGEGITYFFACDECSVTAANYGQS